MSLSRPCLAAFLAGLSVAASDVRPADVVRPAEHEVKAAFLYNFAKFVKWPDDLPPQPTFVIAVLGEDPFGSILERTFAGKSVMDRSVEIRRTTTPEDARGAQILFVCSSEKARLPAVLKALEGSSVLTVGEMQDFSDRGGMVAFRVRDDLVRFDVNLDQVKHARLKMSSQLIRLAQRVLGKTRGG